MARPSTSNLLILLRSNGSIENASFYDVGLLARWRALALKFLRSIFWGLDLTHLRTKSFKTNFGVKKSIREIIAKYSLKPFWERNNLPKMLVFTFHHRR